MKAIILAAWEWSRLRPLTHTTPKPLTQVCGKSILEYTLESIYSHVDEICIVVKYKHELIQETLWDNYKNVKIVYHIQWDEPGTGWAIKWIHYDIDTLIINGDSIFADEDMNTLIKHTGYWALVQRVDQPEKYGIFAIDEDNNVCRVVEKPQQDIWNLASLWAYKINSKFFDLNNSITLSQRGEYELTDTLSAFIKLYPFKALKIQWDFLDITYTWNILDAQEHILSQLQKSEIHGTIEDNVHIKWNIILEEWAIIKSWTYIEWNCYIWRGSIVGPNAYIRGTTSIGHHSKVGFSVECKNSSLGNNTAVAHLSYVWDSIIGNNINLWGGFKVANLKHDKKNIRCVVKWELVDTGKQKLWTIIGDNSKTGINTLIYPGRVLENESTTVPGEIVK